MKKISKKDAVRVLWERGRLEYKLHAGQRELLTSIINAPKKIVTVVSTRRFGKSFLLLLMATELCLKTPNSIVKYICPRKEQVKKALVPLMREIIADCPADLRPTLIVREYIYRFPNGSEIQMAGTDSGNHETIRGGRSELCIVDEAGFCDDLSYVVNSVLLPTTQTTRGKVILVSTPSKSPDHEFILNYMRPAQFDNQLIVRTIYDNPMLTKEQIQETIDAYPLGKNDPEFRREFMCEIIIDDESAVIPEFTDEVEENIVVNWERPGFYDPYVSMDPGFKDLTAVLFAYYDFKNDKVIIEDEIVMNGPTMTTDVLAKLIREKESLIFIDRLTLEQIPTYMRVSDNNLILLNDLQNIHGLTFIPTAKDDKAAAINNARMLIGQGKVIINPRCERLIKHIKGATWDKRRKSFTRSPDNGHYDCIDALVYLLRNITFGKNPYPAGYGRGGSDYFHAYDNDNENSFSRTLKNIFRIK